jgi:hypothetical protein
MKIWNLIQILCRLDPQTEVYISMDPIKGASKERAVSCYSEIDYENQSRIIILVPEMKVKV